MRAVAVQWSEQASLLLCTCHRRSEHEVQAGTGVAPGHPVIPACPTLWPGLNTTTPSSYAEQVRQAGRRPLEN